VCCLHSQGPAQCLRRSLGVIKNDADGRLALCLTADSEDPALCAASGAYFFQFICLSDISSNLNRVEWKYVVKITIF